MTLERAATLRPGALRPSFRTGQTYTSSIKSCTDWFLLNPARAKVNALTFFESSKLKFQQHQFVTGAPGTSFGDCSQRNLQSGFKCKVLVRGVFAETTGGEELPAMAPKKEMLGKLFKYGDKGIQVKYFVHIFETIGYVTALSCQ